MKIIVPVKDILPNPFQARRKMDRDGVQALADEIRENGLWPGALRGRMKSDRVELCYGHRRLQAVKALAWKEVEVEIEELTDEEMAVQNLAENLQREGLTDIEKAQAIHLMMDRSMRAGVKEPEAMQRISRLLGLSPGWIRDLLGLLALEPSIRRAIRDKKIAGRTALEAHRLGGRRMVETAILNKLPVHKISAMAQKIRRIPDERVRDEVKREVVRGRVTTTDAIQEKTRRLLKGRPAVAPDDLDRRLGEWSRRLRGWNAELDELMLYRRFLREPGRADGLQGEIARFTARLQRLTP